jgi:uncharacterized membrane protein
MVMGFSVASALRFGWETFKKRPWLFVGAFVLIVIAQIVVEGVSRAIDAPFGGPESDYAFLGSLVSLALSTLISMGVTAFGLTAHDNPETVELAALWHPHPFWKFLGLSIGFALIAVAGVLGFFLVVWVLGPLFGHKFAVAVVALIYVVLCVILLLMFVFASLFVIDRELGPIAALKESYRITLGHKWPLLGLMVVLGLINLLGLLALVVGLLVSAPVTLLAYTHAYRVLSGTAGVPPPADAALAA